MILFTSRLTAAGLTLPENTEHFDTADLPENWSAALERIRKGESFVFLGTEHIEYLKELWIDSEEGCLTEHSAFCPTPIHFDDVVFSSSGARFLHIRPKSTYAMHGVDEELRADILPLVVSRGKYGDIQGYPGLFVKNYACSLTGGHFKGGFWFIFAIDSPLNALPAEKWNGILTAAANYCSERLYLARFSPEFALYHPAERVRLEYDVENLSQDLAVFTVDFAITDQSGEIVRFIGSQAGSVTAHDCWHGRYDWYPRQEDRYVSLKAFLRRHDRFDCGLKRITDFSTVDEAEAGVFIKQTESKYPKVETDRNNIAIDGETSFFVGTHLYASSDFFELGYRHIRMPELKRTVESIKRAGFRVCRIWCDPILDEESLRGMEAYLELFAQNDIAVIFTLFSSWTFTMETNLPDSHLKFEVASMKDDCLLGLYLHNIPEQREFAAILGKRFSHMSHIVWDLSNEFSVVDPTEEHLEESWLNPSFRKQEPPYQSIDLFRQWAQQIRGALENSGVASPMIFGVSCWDTGSENYRCTKEGDLIGDHSYRELEQSGLFANFQNTVCIQKPFYMEEYGGTWADDRCRADETEGRLHYFLGAGHCAAVNYEWGVSWLCDQLPGMPPYMKFVENIAPDESKTFLYEGRYSYAKSWPLGGVGLCPWTASFDYGSAFGCVDSISRTVFRMSRIANLGSGLALTPTEKDIYLVLPFETGPFKARSGYNRKTDKICNTIRTLWSHGIPFQIWQEDELRSIPDSAGLVLYPNEEKLTVGAKAGLDRIRSRGIEVCRDEPEIWLNHPIVRALSIDCGDNLVLYRDTPPGPLTVIARENAKTVRIGGITLGVDRFGAFIDNGGLLLAEFTGELEQDDRLLAKSTCKCLLRSNDNMPFLNSSELLLYPYDCGRICLMLPFTRATLMNGEDEIIDSFPLEQSEEGSVIVITRDLLPYKLRIE